MNQVNDFLHINSDALAKEQLKKNWNWFFMLGICLVALGSLSVLFSFVSTVISVAYLGFLMLFIGFFEGVKSLKMSRWAGFFLHLFLCVLYVVAGCFIVINPESNALTLTLLLAIFFVVSGVLRIVFSFARHVPHQPWLFLNGALTLVLGVLIWMQWPASGLWVIGTLMGIDLLFTGWTWIMLALTAKNLTLDQNQV